MQLTLSDFNKLSRIRLSRGNPGLVRLGELKGKKEKKRHEKSLPILVPRKVYKGVKSLGSPS